MKIKSERITKINKGRNPKNSLVGTYEVEISGVSGDDIVQAIFGSFDIRDGIARYSATLWTNDNGKIYHDYQSEFADDYEFLRCSI